MELLPVPAFRMTPSSSACGAATLKMLLMYWQLQGQELMDVEIGKQIGTDPHLGTSPEALMKGAEQFGLITVPKQEASFDDVRHWLDKKVPVVVDWFSRGNPNNDHSEMADGHYSIVVGLNDEYIYIQDSETGGLREVLRGEFLRVWFDFRGEQITTWENMMIRWMCAMYPKA